MRSKKIPTSEKKKQAYKPKPKQQNMKYNEPEIHEIFGIRYIMLGNTPYAVDEKNVIDYALTGQLRKMLDNQSKD